MEMYREGSVNFSDVSKLLTSLDSVYPDSRLWLQRVVSEVERGEADAVSYYNEDGLQGLVFGVSKGDKGYKIRTVYVSSEVRGCGVGTQLLDQILTMPSAASADRVYMTVTEELLPSLQPLLDKYSFNEVTFLKERYLPNKNEIVLVRQQ